MNLKKQDNIISDLIYAIEAQQVEISDFEEEFISSIWSKISHGCKLSHKEEHILVKIHGRIA